MADDARLGNIRLHHVGCRIEDGMIVAMKPHDRERCDLCFLLALLREATRADAEKANGN